MNVRHRQRLWRRFRQAWLRDDAGAQSYEPVAAPVEIPLRLWPAQGRPARIVYFSKDLLLRSWVDRGIGLPRDWFLLERAGIPDLAHLSLLTRICNMVRAPACFIGDLDPLDLTSFLVLRALSIDFVGRRRALPVTWVGISDPWIRLCRRSLAPGRASLPTVPMGALEREHWRVLAVVAPELRAMLGPESTAILDGGQKLDIAGASGGFYTKAFPGRLLRLLKGAVKHAHRS